MKQKLLLSIMVLMCCALQAIAQTKITGTVIGKADGQPLIGATVREVGTKQAAVTDFDGNFSIDVKPGAQLQITYVGCDPVTVKAANGMKVTLADAAELEELVVTGYQVQRKADLTGAVAVMDMKQPKSEGDPNLLSSLQGKLPGVEIVTDATPGGSGSIRVRGVSTVNNASPLYVIDGVATENDFNSLNPDDIESIQVLKDASSASIYGSRAANGVIVVTTKKGKQGKMQINLNYNASLQTVAKSYDVLNTQQWGQMYWQAMKNTANGGSYTVPTDVAAIYGNGDSPVIQSSANGYKISDTDWQDQLYSSAWTHNIGASISNASEKGSYLMSANYVNQKGMMDETFYRRITGRVNSTYNFNKYIRVGENFSIASWTNRGAASTDGDRATSHIAISQHPAVPADITNPKDMLASNDFANPLKQLALSSDNEQRTWRIFGNAYIEVMPIKGLTLKSNIGIEHREYTARTLGRSTTTNNIDAKKSETTVSYTMKPEDTWTWTNTANYNWTIAKDHHFNALFGVEAIKYSTQNVDASRSNYAFDDANYMQLSTGTKIENAAGCQSDWGLFSLFGKLDYNYADRYLFSFTLRNDKSSRLSPDNNTGTFPAFSGAWRVSEEKFWPKNKIVDDLKVRVAWGQNGNANINNLYAAYTLYSYGNSWGYNIAGTNGTVTPGVYKTQTGNKDLKWETTTQTNLGIDMNLLDRKFILSFDYYWKTTKDMITTPPVLSAAGLNAAYARNTGSMDNKGFELSLTYNSPQYGDFSWTGSINVSKYKNELTALNDATTYDGDNYRLMVGQPVGVYYGYVVDGIFQNAEEVANHAEQDGKGVGRLRYRDLNGDGKITEADRCVIGDPNPAAGMGINLSAKYKNWTLSTFFSGEFGFDIYNRTRAQLEFASYSETLTNRGTAILDAWTPTNTSSTIPAVTTIDTNGETSKWSTYFVESGSYMKCKYIKLAYDFKSDWMKKCGINNLSLYAQCENVFVITSYSGLDPEVTRSGYGQREDNTSYPRSRTFSMGINLGF